LRWIEIHLDFEIALVDLVGWIIRGVADDGEDLRRCAGAERALPPQAHQERRDGLDLDGVPQRVAVGLLAPPAQPVLETALHEVEEQAHVDIKPTGIGREGARGVDNDTRAWYSADAVDAALLDQRGVLGVAESVLDVEHP